MDRNYTENQFIEARDWLMRKTLARSCLAVAAKPQAYLLGGQSGAGKTTLHYLLKKRFNDNVIVVNGDEYRSMHPLYRELDRKHGAESVKHTAEWAGRMTEALIDAFSSIGYNLIVEGALRTAEVPIKTATLLRERGYAVSLALMAVKPEISLLSCQIRYEQMRIAGTVPRATDPAHHNKIVHDIVDSLATLEQSGLFGEVLLYNRAEEQLFPCEKERRTASQALQDVLFGKWTAEELKHKKSLEELWVDLKARAKQHEAEVRRRRIAGRKKNQT